MIIPKHGEAGFLPADVYRIGAGLSFGNGELNRLSSLGTDADHPGLLHLAVYFQSKIVVAGLVAGVDHVAGYGQWLISHSLLRIDAYILH